MKVCPQCQQEYALEVDFCPADGTKLRARREEGEDPLIGRALDGRWVVEEKLGEGGMGAVYKGHQKSVSRTVAIKVLRPQLVENEEFVDRFFREAKIAATISHPNSVTILDYGESSDGTLYLAMEYLDGELLTDRIESGRLTIRQVLEIAIQVASALSAAHDANIVHRDLKPDNIFLLDVPGGATFIKVLDFGIAKMLDSKTQVTKTGMIFGTPEYMSPEQCRGDKIDGRSDLYSLGCIMYELVGGRTPFRATTPMAVLMAHVNQAAPALAPDGTAAHVPPAVERIIMRLLEKKPEDRYPSAEALRETLEAVLAALDSPTGSMELVPPVPSREIVAAEVNIGFDATMGMAATGPSNAVEQPAEKRRSPIETDALEAARPASKAPLLAVAIVLVLCVIGLGGVLVAMQFSGDESAASEVPEPTPEIVVPAEPPTPPPAAVAAATADAGQTDSGATAEVAAAKVDAKPMPEPELPEKRTKSKKSKKRAEPRDEPTVDASPKPQPEPEPTVDASPKPQPEPAAKPSSQPKPKPKKGEKKLDDKINKKAEKVRDDVVEGTEKALDKMLDGLL